MIVNATLTGLRRNQLQKIRPAEPPAAKMNPHSEKELMLVDMKRIPAIDLGLLNREEGESDLSTKLGL
jgi:hypothetical protein